jgi:hypothetical protein
MKAEISAAARGKRIRRTAGRNSVAAQARTKKVGGTIESVGVSPFDWCVTVEL